ncbi:MAG: homoserine dehydrogenase [Peptostreptococcaceae bacterium]|nr:homoserine dehydrogenase [Peptostreptococcaceae bacterium]
MKQINIGLLGIGNVGGGTYQILNNNHDVISERTDADIRVTKALTHNLNKKRKFEIPSDILTTNADEILNDSNINIIVEALGGIEPASTYMLKAMQSGKHVVTANKAAVAANYEKLMTVANENNVMLLTEACVAGAIPALASIQTSLQGNRFYEVSGILNGTTNYIMSKMYNEGLAYADVLKDAQAKGFAEADPTDDVMGYDIANKLSILVALTFNQYIHPKDIPTVGITNITKEDIDIAKTNGTKIKLIGSAILSETGKLSCSVKPVNINCTHPLFSVDNEFNAVYLKGDAFGELMYYGKGAGPLPTGSAVVGDIISIINNIWR